VDCAYRQLNDYIAEVEPLTSSRAWCEHLTEPISKESRIDDGRPSAALRPLVGAAAAATGVLVGLGRHGKGSIFSEADQAVAQLPLANIAFTALQMLAPWRDDNDQVQLVLSARESIRRLKKRLSEIGVKHGARIRASNRMEAHLVGSGFKIEALRPEIQVVTRVAPTEWKWDVDAAKAGTHHLTTLTVSAFIDLEGESTPLLAKTFDKTLTVRVTLHQRASRFVSRKLAVALDRDWSSSCHVALCGPQAKEEHSPQISCRVRPV
jgi:hypothetical protein